MNWEKQTMPRGNKAWNAFLIAELRELLEKDVCVVQDKRFTEASLHSLLDWMQLCRLYYRETDDLLTNIYYRIGADFEETEKINNRIMESFLILKANILRLQADEEDHSYVAWKRSRPFHSDAPIRDESRLNADDLTVRSYNVLIRSGIESVDQLKSLSEEQLQSIKKLGRVSLHEVLEYRRRMLQADNPSKPEGHAMNGG